MSDTTEAMAPAPATVPPKAGAAAPVLPAISAPDLVRLVQGFYFIFWGLLVTVLVGAQILLLFWLHTFAEMFLAAGVFGVLTGTWRLYQTRLGTPARVPSRPGPAVASADAGPLTAAVGLWRRHVGRLLTLAVLLTYFCVLFYLWRRAPLGLYLQLNALLFVAVGIVYVAALSRTVYALAGLLGRRQLAQESRLYGIGTLALLVGPFLGAVAYLATRTVTRHSNPLVEFHFLITRLNLLISILVLLPFSLTLSLVWSAKDAALQRLAALAEAS